MAYSDGGTAALLAESSRLSIAGAFSGTLKPQKATRHVSSLTEHTLLHPSYCDYASKISADSIDLMEKGRRSGFAQFVDKLAVESELGLTNAQLMLANHDLKPVEPERRQWRSRNFVYFWVADSFNITTWMIASASILDGLSPWQAWLCIWIGYTIAASFICLTGRIGAVYHISFPVVNRASFGIWGSLWPVLNRALMACIWYGVQSWIGGTCVYLMIRSIWPSWDDYGPDGSKNNMPVSSGTNTRDFVSFLLFWLGSLPFLWFPIHKIRHLFTVKAYVAPIAGISFFIWSIVRANGIGPVVHKGATVHGNELGWAIVKGIMSSIANFAALIVNNPDFARFAATPRSVLWSQLFTIPCGFALTSLIGIIVASSSTVIFDKTIWSPLDLLKLFLEESNVSGWTRLSVFVIAASFVLAQLGTNIAANSVSAGTNLTALMPRYLNIRRGSYICAIVGIVMCPWHLLSSSNNFITYLSAYSVFLSSIAGVMISDYYFVRKGYLRTRDLYSPHKDGPYFYTWGVHWRGYAAYIAGILINTVGFAGAVGFSVPLGATYSKYQWSRGFYAPANRTAVYNMNFFTGCLLSSAVYWLLCKVWRIPATSNTWMEVDEDVTGKNDSLVYGVDVGDDERDYSTAAEDFKKERLQGRDTYELQGLLETDHEERQSSIEDTHNHPS